MQKDVFDINFVDTDHQYAVIFAKPLSEDCFAYIRENLNMVSLSN